MNFAAAHAKMRELFAGKMWSLDIKTMHFSDATETLAWDLGYSGPGGWVFVSEPTFELAVEKLLRMCVEGEAKTTPEEVGEVSLPEAPVEPSEMKAAAPADETLPF